MSDGQFALVVISAVAVVGGAFWIIWRERP